MGITITPRTGCWLQYQLKLRNFTLEPVARKANVSIPMVTHFLKGRKNSEKVKKALAEVLGYESFEKLIAASRGKEAV
ncbi:MAG: helix-turn-helix transcriptional regulator [Treponema sp.]|jgi:transcriptional regulator with XRE-family HTH domain|nr:helix-turn-helix transcriptional regulator [Treponema sp.]